MMIKIRYNIKIQVSRILVTFLCMVGISTIAFSQISKNSLVILVKEKDSVYINDETFVKMRYEYRNNNEGWWLLFDHVYGENYNENNFQILLPNKTVNQYQKNGNIVTTDELEHRLDALNLDNASKYMRLNYPPYYYEYLDDNVYKTQRRFNIFLLKESDLQNDYVPLYEVSLIMGLNEAH